MEEKKEGTYGHRYDTVAAFLSLEFIAVALFGLGGSLFMPILQLLGVFVAMLVIPFIRNNVGGSKQKKLLIYVIALAAFLLPIGFGNFWSNAYYGGNGLTIAAYGGLMVLGGVAFFVIGYGIRSIKPAKPKYIVLSLLVGLAAYVAITLVYSMVRYGPFYVSRYAGMVYYYDGIVYPISREGKALLGFEFYETTLAFSKFAAFLLASCASSLLFLHPKKDKLFFFMVLGLSGLGLLDLVLTPFKKGLILLLVVYGLSLLVFLLRFLWKKGDKYAKKIGLVLKIVFFVLVGVTLLGVLALLIDASNGFLRNMGIPYLSAALQADEGFFGSIRVALQTLLGVRNHNFSLLSFLFGVIPSSMLNTSSFEFNLLWQSGFLAFLMLLVILFYSLRQARDFLVHDSMHFGVKYLIVALLLGAFICLTFQADDAPLIYYPTTSFVPLSRSMVSFGLLGVLGMMYAIQKEEQQ